MIRIALAAALALAAPAAAQTGLAVRLDNDILAPRGTGAPPDFDYTHGLHVAAELGEAGGARVRLRGGQEIYTPRRDAPDPIPGERPYAAWLYAALDARVGERTVSLELGVVGPPALGEPVQNGFHALAGSRRQEGWAHQLRAEPGVRLRFADERVLRWGAVRLRPGWSASLGNVRTAAQADAAVRVGGDGGAYVEVAGAREWVARDLFLDGNTFRGGSTARKLPFVTTGEAAAGYAFRAWALEYRFTARTRQYRAQPEGHTFGSVTLRVRSLHTGSRRD